MKFNVPTKLTFLRLFLAVVIIILLLFPFYRIGFSFKTFLFHSILIDVRYILCGVIFILASFTDYLDGYLARSRNLVTTFGKFMDPLADKILACSALVMLVQFGKVEAWMVCIVLAREFIISGFRLIAASNGIVISASIYGKIKTITQLFAISFILLNSTRLIKIPLNIDVILWYISVVFTIISAIDYISKNIKVLDLKNI